MKSIAVSIFANLTWTGLNDSRQVQILKTVSDHLYLDG